MTIVIDKVFNQLLYMGYSVCVTTVLAVQNIRSDEAAARIQVLVCVMLGFTIPSHGLYCLCLVLKDNASEALRNTENFHLCFFFFY